MNDVIIKRSDDYLAHHGIKGMKWGVRHDPERVGRNGTSRTPEGQSKHKRGLSSKAKRRLKVGAAIVGTALVAYGAYKLGKSGQLDNLISLGKNKLKGRQFAGNAGEIVKKLSKPETHKDSLNNANPLKGTLEGRNNCVPSAIAGFLRSKGYDVTAKGTGGSQKIAGGVVEDCFRNAKVLDGKAVTFGKSKQDAADFIVRKFGNDGEGLCSVDLRSKIDPSIKGGHCFSWKAVKGKVDFYDYNTGKASADDLFERIVKDGQLTVADLSKAEVVEEALSKYLNT